MKSDGNVNKSKGNGYWPADVVYLQRQLYHPSVPSEVLSYLNGKTFPRSGELSVVASQCSSSRNVPNYVVVRTINDTTHPAFGQYGLYAYRKIPPFVKILDYLGEVHADERPASDYDLSLYRLQDGTVNIGVSLRRNSAFVYSFML